jgi:hypothetical protein
MTTAELAREGDNPTPAPLVAAALPVVDDYQKERLVGGESRIRKVAFAGRTIKHQIIMRW